MKRVRVFLTALIVGGFMFATPVQADVVCNTYTHFGDDDSAFPANLPFTLTLGATEYDQVFISTNGTMTFGAPDGTYWDYPQTPSVSVAGFDWVTFGEGAYLSYGSTANTFCAEWSVRPYPQSSGDLTQIRLVINKADNGGWHGEIVTFGWLPSNVRRGIRFEQGQNVVPMEAAFDVNGGVPVEVAPAPTPSSFTEPPIIPSPEPTPQPTESVTPTPTVEPTPIVSPTQSATPTQTPELVTTPSSTPTPVVEPPVVPAPAETVEAIATATPTPQATTQPEPSPTVTAFEPPIVEPAPSLVEQVNSLLQEFVGEPITFEALQESGLDYSDLPAETPVTLENGVVLTAEVASALQIFDSGTELLITIFSDPAKALKALANIGADMTPEQRETSQNTVVAAVVVTQIAQVRKTK
jgi:hypothetical protein